MKRYLLITLLLLPVLILQANNLQITNVTQTGNNISFTLSWDNSWNTTNNINPLYPNNWDAVWVFVKYQNQIDNLWKHAKLSSTAGHHSISGGGATLQVDPVQDSMGVFIRRSSPGAGNISSASVTLNMGPRIGTGAFNFKVFGVEMVYAPQDTLQAGDGLVSAATYFSPITITSAKQASGLIAGELYTGSPAIPATYPMGFNAFYCMKYEATNEQWVDFLNTLTYDQQASRIEVAPNAALGTNAYTPSVTQEGIIEIVVPGLNNTQPAVFGCDFTEDNNFNTSNDGQNIPFLAVGKGDMLAYLDWAGLRPMTELEYEKACRGPRPRISTEYAWGSTNYASRTRANIINGGTATEASSATVTNGQVIASSGAASQGPARNGIFATASSGRESSGASFYGIMEMSGNLWELMVTTGTGGLAITASSNGDGTLSTNGNANVATWPDPFGTTGIATRGGSWWETSNSTVFTRIAYRHNVAVGVGRSYVYGIRGVRSAN
ncbi:SUMF1/EgtB/PvdO family nonheme iron enzyme [Phnomibacter sp. MR]|uniref:SUMF1/EgtB/PvdO family nonheme iron enzyme n=1 Tax=Phnomibacter sp. MR TaxID=3042318 RepID=UPI003A7FC4D6